MPESYPPYIPELVSSKEPLKESNFVILAPDDPSGRAFENSFKQIGLNLPYQEVSIRPRVLDNNRSPNIGVYADFLDAVREEYSQGHTHIVIACNTLQFWAHELMAHPEIYENMPNLNIYSTFDVAKAAYPHRDQRPMWLGTSVTSSLLDKDDFDTPINTGLTEIQAHIQEIIWRTKASTIPPADYSGAGNYIEDISNPQLLHTKTIELVQKLREQGIKKFFLGCTELPIAFDTLSENELEGVKAIDVADVMAKAVFKELYPSGIPEN